MNEYISYHNILVDQNTWVGAIFLAHPPTADDQWLGDQMQVSHKIQRLWHLGSRFSGCHVFFQFLLEYACDAIYWLYVYRGPIVSLFCTCIYI